MSDEPPFYAPNYRPPPRVGKAGEPVWSIRWRNATWHCELRFHGEGYGWECLLFRETDFVIGRRFLLKEEAIGWGEWMKGEIESGRMQSDLEEGGA